MHPLQHSCLGIPRTENLARNSLRGHDTIPCQTQLEEFHITCSFASQILFSFLKYEFVIVRLLISVTVSFYSTKRFPHYGSVDMRRQCVKGNGRCKNECHVSEVRIAYCLRPGTHCCLQK